MAKPASTPHAITRRFNRGAAQAVRDEVPIEVFVEHLLCILMGHADATWTRDARTTSGWRMTWPDNGRASTPEEKFAAARELRHMGWGLPAQSHIIQAEVTQHDGRNLASAIPAGVISPQLIYNVRRMLEADREARRLDTTAETRVRELEQAHEHGDDVVNVRTPIDVTSTER